MCRTRGCNEWVQWPNEIHEAWDVLPLIFSLQTTCEVTCGFGPTDLAIDPEIASCKSQWPRSVDCSSLLRNPEHTLQQTMRWAHMLPSLQSILTSTWNSRRTLVDFGYDWITSSRRIFALFFVFFDRLLPTPLALQKKNILQSKTFNVGKTWQNNNKPSPVSPFL